MLLHIDHITNSANKILDSILRSRKNFDRQACSFESTTVGMKVVKSILVCFEKQGILK